LEAPATAPSETRGASRLAIDAVPPTARLSLDGVALDGNPYAGSVPQDGSTHLVRAEASGYASAERVIVADMDVTVHFTLAPMARPPGRLAGSRPPSSPPFKPAEAPSEHAIDPGDPYVK
jgi:hypothetical protein